MAGTSLKAKVTRSKKRHFQAFGFELLCIIIMDYGVMLRCNVMSRNDVMPSSDIINITSVAQKDCKIYDAGGV